MNNHNQIQTPLLSFFLKYFGNLSVQFYPWNFTSPSFLWNLILVGLFFWKIYDFDDAVMKDHYLNPNMENLYDEKPLYDLLVHNITTYMSPICYCAVTFHYLALSYNSSKLLRLLDSFTLSLYRERAQRIFWVTVIFHQITHFAMFYQVFYLILRHTNSWPNLLLMYLSMYTLNINQSVTFFVIIYFKCATFFTLKQIVSNLKNTNLKSDVHHFLVKKEITKLAYLNKELHSQLSFPFLCSLFPFVVHILGGLSTLMVKRFTESNYYLLQFVVILAYFAFIEESIQSQLMEIRKVLLGHTDTELYWVSRKLYLTDSNGNLNTREQLYWRELLSIYRTYYTLRLFNLWKINWRFLVSLALFILNYVVLITQTSTKN